MHYLDCSPFSCESDIVQPQEVRSLINSIMKIRENRLNEFKDKIIEILLDKVEQEFNETELRRVRRHFYDLIGGASCIEVNRLLSEFIPILEEMHKNEDIRFNLSS